MSENSIKSIFAKRLKELQEQQGNITQNQFAEKIGISPNTLSLYYKGVKNPTLTTLVKIAEAYDVSIDWLCGMSEKLKYNTMTTYADVFCAIIDIVNAFESHGYNCNLTDKGGADQDDEEWFLCSALLISENKKIDELFGGWGDIKKLYDKKIINSELYNAWIEQKKRELDIPLDTPKPEEKYPF